MRHSVDAVRRLGWVYPCVACGDLRELWRALDRLRARPVEAPMSESGWLSAGHGRPILGGKLTLRCILPRME